MNPLISIIIPTYNRAHLIGETLDSVLLQTYTNWECIVVDDGSTDGTENLLAEYCAKDSRFQYYHRPTDKPKGANACRNFGFQISKGDYIKWFDSDDILDKEALEKISNSFKINTDVIVSSLSYINFEGVLIDKKHKFISKNLIEDYLCKKITFYICTPTWKRTFLNNQTLLFDEKISNLDDWDFNLRMLYKNPIIGYIDESLIYYRVHDNSLSHEIDKLNFNEIKSEFVAREKHLNLIKRNKMANPINIKRNIVNRYYTFYRKAMINNDIRKKYYFKMLIIKKIQLFDYMGCLKTLFGFFIYIISKRGYKFL